MYKVLIVEDDPMVASIDKQYLETSDEFEVIGSVRNGADALEFLKKQDVQLIILDYFMPGMNGDEFLDKMHALHKIPYVIMVTSASDGDIIRNLLMRGVNDYLVKPFAYERFFDAMEKFRKTQELMSSVAGGDMEQQQIDHLISSVRSDSSNGRPMPKGLHSGTMENVREKLRMTNGNEFTCEEAAEMVGLSRITIRRYLNYLSDVGEIISRMDYDTGGRPGIVYSYVDKHLL